ATVGLGFPTDVVLVGDRFAHAASRGALERIIRPRRPLQRVLVPGCYLAGEEVQTWLREGVGEVNGIDVYNLRSRWNQIVPALEDTFRVKVSFQQASVEHLSFDDDTFDLVCRLLLVKKVRNVEAMVNETHRVLQPGGAAWHFFG